MRLPLFCSLILSVAGCATDPAFQLETSYDLDLKLQEDVCDSMTQSPAHEVNGTLSVADSATPEAHDLSFEVFVIPEASITFQLRDVHFTADGSFEGWSSEAFDRGGDVFVPFFHDVQGTATTQGLDAQYTVYMSDNPSDSSVPVCRYVWQVHSR